jgi:5-formyltetrahydrofolate cyclo-ligase
VIDIEELKDQLRATIRVGRAARPEADRELARHLIADSVLGWCRQAALAPGGRVLGYDPLATEPGSSGLLDRLLHAGYEVLVPVTLADNDLDWRRWPDGSDRLGKAAISSAALILVPAFAVDRAGHRLGRGGGSYDRALPRAHPDAVIAALLFDGEVIDDVPVASWDAAVHGAFCPSGFQACGPER